MEIPNSSSHNSTLPCENDDYLPESASHRTKSKQIRARRDSTSKQARSQGFKATSRHSSSRKSSSRGRSKESKATDKVVKSRQSSSSNVPQSNGKSTANEPRDVKRANSRDFEGKTSKGRSKSRSRYAASKGSLSKTKSSTKHSSAPNSERRSERRRSSSTPVEAATKDRKQTAKAESESKASRMRRQTSFRGDVNKQRSLVTPQSDLVRKQLFLLSDPSTSLPKQSTTPADMMQEQASCIPEEFLFEMERLDRENQDLRRKLEDANKTIERMHRMQASSDSLLEASFAVDGDSSSELNLNNNRSISTGVDAIGSPANMVANPSQSQNSMYRTSLLKRSSSFAKRKASFWSREKASNAATLSSSFSTLIGGQSDNNSNNEQSSDGKHKNIASFSMSEHNVSSALEKQMRYRRSLSAGSPPKRLSSSMVIS